MSKLSKLTIGLASTAAAVGMTFAPHIATPMISATAYGATPNVTVGAGTTIYIADSLLPELSQAKCTVAYVKGETAVTAAHCVKPGQKVYNDKGQYLGAGEWSRTGESIDVAGIKIDSRVDKVQTPLDRDLPETGTKVYKLGSTTGVTEGYISDGVPQISISTGQLTPWLPITVPVPVNVSLAKLCAQPGDSGGPIVDAKTNKVVGVISSIDAASVSGCTENTETSYTPLSIL